jgi:hypothetical protein
MKLVQFIFTMLALMSLFCFGVVIWAFVEVILWLTSK